MSLLHSDGGVNWKLADKLAEAISEGADTMGAQWHLTQHTLVDLGEDYPPYLRHH